jgi:hypothetical protein
MNDMREIISEHVCVIGWHTRYKLRFELSLGWLVLFHRTKKARMEKLCSLFSAYLKLDFYALGK